MKRFLNYAVCLALAVACPFGNELSAQDVTITVTQKSDKDAPEKDAKKPFKGKRPSVEVAILLDTSNSMDGLISQAKSQLWKIIQQFAEAQKNGQTPVLRVSVFEYGNSNLPASENYIRQVVQLTDDMDKVSEALFALKTDGGDEYCGTVIEESIKRLDWSSEPNAFKAIFIAGNEPFTQGPVDYHKSCSKAIQSGIIINTIHCGDYNTGVSGKWKHGAQLGEGEYMNINQDHQVVDIKTPQDKIIIQLNADLNKTYLWYGAVNDRTGYAENQIEQDYNAKSSSFGGFFSRGRAKSSKAYSNLNRDLVDTMDQDEAILGKVKPSELPLEMQKMSAEERIAHVKKMKAKRVEIQKKIVEASKARDLHIAEKRKEIPNSDESTTFGDAVSAAIDQQLQASGFEAKK